uniref:Uncharacterized protein n=1 Tax=Opuntia streptacantha TaxID=393608 RepID=A0A7C9AI99_OPUST
MGNITTSTPTTLTPSEEVRRHHQTTGNAPKKTKEKKDVVTLTMVLLKCGVCDFLPTTTTLTQFKPDCLSRSKFQHNYKHRSSKYSRLHLQHALTHHKPIL